VITRLLLIAGVVILLGLAVIGPQIASKVDDLLAPEPAVDSDRSPRLYRYGEYIRFQTPKGPQTGSIEGFYWDRSDQTWFYDIQGTEGVLFENVRQEEIIGTPETPP
jgi:hypothetical protein